MSLETDITKFVPVQVDAQVVSGVAAAWKIRSASIIGQDLTRVPFTSKATADVDALARVPVAAVVAVGREIGGAQVGAGLPGRPGLGRLGLAAPEPGSCIVSRPGIWRRQAVGSSLFACVTSRGRSPGRRSRWLRDP